MHATPLRSLAGRGQLVSSVTSAAFEAASAACSSQDTGFGALHGCEDCVSQDDLTWRCNTSCAGTDQQGLPADAQISWLVKSPMGGDGMSTLPYCNFSW